MEVTVAGQLLCILIVPYFCVFVKRKKRARWLSYEFRDYSYEFRRGGMFFEQKSFI